MILVDDSPRNIQAAEKEGYKTILANTLTGSHIAEARKLSEQLRPSLILPTPSYPSTFYSSPFAPANSTQREMPPTPFLSSSTTSASSSSHQPFPASFKDSKVMRQLFPISDNTSSNKDEIKNSSLRSSSEGAPTPY